MTLVGTGGTGNSSTGNRGILTSYLTLTTADGAISLTGTGGASAATENTGVEFNYGSFSASGSGESVSREPEPGAAIMLMASRLKLLIPFRPIRALSACQALATAPARIITMASLLTLLPSILWAGILRLPGPAVAQLRELRIMAFLSMHRLSLRPARGR